MAVLEHDGSETAEDGGKPPRPGRQLIKPAATLLAAAWIIPLAVNAIHADWILPPLLLLGTATLLHVGYTLLDRLVIAAALLAGLLITAGLLFSLWPWHLSPAPMAVFSFTVLGAVGLGIHHRHGRLPHLPKRVRGTDLILLAAPVIAWALLRRPIHGKSFADALPYTAKRHDTMNHYSLYDAIHRIGGYQYFHQGQAKPYIDEMMGYNPGTHYLYALLDIFRRSSTDPGESLPEFLRFAQYEALGFCLLVIAVPWAARWITGPAITGWRKTLIVATAAALAVFGQLSTLFWQSFDAEALGLALLSVTVALVARPPQRVHEQVFLTGALLIALAWVYDLYLVIAGIAVLSALTLYRKRITGSGRTRDFTIRIAALTVAFGMVPIAFALSLHSVSGLFTEDGAFVDFSRGLSVGFGVIAMAAVLTRVGRRSPVWRTTSITVASACTFAFFTELYGHLSVGSAQYYSSKLVDAAWVVSLCGVGSLALFLKDDTARQVNGQSPAAQIPTRAVRRRRSVERFATSALAVALPVAFTNGFPMSAHWEQNAVENQGTSITVIWSRGHIVPSWSPYLAAYARVGTFGDGRSTVFEMPSTSRNSTMSMIMAALNHRLGAQQLMALEPADLLKLHLSPDLSSPDSSFEILNGITVSLDQNALSPKEAQALDKVETWIRAQPPGLRIVVGNRVLAQLVENFAASEPQHSLTAISIVTP